MGTMFSLFKRNNYEQSSGKCVFLNSWLWFNFVFKFIFFSYFYFLFVSVSGVWCNRLFSFLSHFYFLFNFILCTYSKSIKLEPYDITTMYAYAQGGPHQGPPHYAPPPPPPPPPPTYHIPSHHHHHQFTAASMSPLTASLSGTPPGVLPLAVDQHHMQNQHMTNVTHHTGLHHLEPQQLTELSPQSKRRRYVFILCFKILQSIEDSLWKFKLT